MHRNMSAARMMAPEIVPVTAAIVDEVAGVPGEPGSGEEDMADDDAV